MLTSHRVANAVVVGGACCEVLHGSGVQDTCRLAMLGKSVRAESAPAADSLSQGSSRAHSQRGQLDTEEAEGCPALAGIDVACAVGNASAELSSGESVCGGDS